MVQKFRMPKYVNIWQSNANGDKGELLMEAQMGGRRRDTTSAQSRDGFILSIMRN